MGEETFGASRNKIQPSYIYSCGNNFYYMFLAVTSSFLEHGRAGLLGQDVTEQVTLRQGLGG